MGSHPERAFALSLTGLGGSSNFFGSGAGLRSRSLLASFLQATYNTLRQSLTSTSTLIQKNTPEQGRTSQTNQITNITINTVKTPSVCCWNAPALEPYTISLVPEAKCILPRDICKYFKHVETVVWSNSPLTCLSVFKAWAFFSGSLLITSDWLYEWTTEFSFNRFKNCVNQHFFVVETGKMRMDTVLYRPN